MPKQAKSKHNISATKRPRKHGPSPLCRYCTKKLPRHKPNPLHYCNAKCEASNKP